MTNPRPGSRDPCLVMSRDRIANRKNYMTNEKPEELTEDINHETRMLVSLINKL